MRRATLISAIVTLLLMLATMICGLWLKAGNPGDISFHIYCGIAAVIFCGITVVLMTISMRSTKKEVDYANIDSICHQVRRSW